MHGEVNITRTDIGHQIRISKGSLDGRTQIIMTFFFRSKGAVPWRNWCLL
jgi:hypothetical protein